jgi:hypothetical protein
MKSTRRDALKALGVSVGVVALGSVETLARASTRTSPTSRDGRASRDEDTALFDGLPGMRFSTCEVTAVGDLEHGTIPIAFVDPQGQTFVVDVLRHDPALPGVARAGSLGVYIKVGRGQRATDEAHGLAAMALARELAFRQENGARVPALLTLTERAPVRTSWNRRDAVRIA